MARPPRETALAALLAPLLVVACFVAPLRADDLAPFRLVNGLYGQVTSHPQERFQVEVRLRSPSSAPAVEAAVVEGGGRVEAAAGARLQVRASGALILQLAGREDVLFIRPVRRALKRGHGTAGPDLPVTLPPVPGLKELHDAGITGRGVKIGVVDGGFYGYRSLLGSALPASVHVKGFRHDGCGIDSCPSEEHGTAVAELIHQVAPDAELYLAAVQTDIEFEQAVKWLEDRGVAVVNGSIGFVGCGPEDGQSQCSLVAAGLREAGILPVFAAGNDALNHWQGLAQDRDGDGLLETNASAEFILFQVARRGPVEVVADWDDWGPDPTLPASDQDIDIYIFSLDLATGAFRQVAAGEDEQAGLPGEEPVERVDFVASPDLIYAVVLKDYSTTRPFLVDVTVEGEWVAGVWPDVPRGSIISPADSPAVVAVGAATENGVIHPYSAQGPLWNGYLKPDLTAPSGLSTQTYGQGGFFGTSASAPVVAGLGGLLRQTHPDWGPDRLQAALEMWATDIGPPGQDSRSGMGLVSVAQALDYGDPAVPPAGLLLAGGQGPQGITLGYDGSTFLAAVDYLLPPEEGGGPVWWAAQGQAQDHFAGPAPMVAFHSAGGNATASPAGRLVIMVDDQGRVEAEARDTLNRELLRWEVEPPAPLAGETGQVQWWTGQGVPALLFTQQASGYLGAVLYGFDPAGGPVWSQTLAPLSPDHLYTMESWRLEAAQQGEGPAPQVQEAGTVLIQQTGPQGLQADLSPFYPWTASFVPLPF